MANRWQIGSRKTYTTGLQRHCVYKGGGYLIGITNTDLKSKKLIEQYVDLIIDDYEDDISKEHL